MDEQQLRQPAQLFIVRLWHEGSSDEQIEWRGRVQHVTSGEVRYFREWATLVDILFEHLATSRSSLRPQDRHTS